MIECYCNWLAPYISQPKNGTALIARINKLCMKLKWPTYSDVIVVNIGLHKNSQTVKKGAAHAQKGSIKKV